MKYRVVYESRTGNTEKVAKAIAECFPAEQTELTNLMVQQPYKDAEVYFVGFGVRQSTCSLRVLDFLSLLHDKTVVLFATCGMEPTQAYHDVLERVVEAFLPDVCDYRGLFLCRGAVTEEGIAALKGRLNGDAEKIERLEAFCATSQEHPNDEDLEHVRRFLEHILE